MESVVGSADLESRTVPEEFGVEFYAGSPTAGPRMERSDAVGVTVSMLGLLKECRTLGYDCAILTRRLRISRTIEAEDSSEAFDERNLIGVRMSVRRGGGASRVVTLSKVVRRASTRALTARPKSFSKWS